MVNKDDEIIENLISIKKLIAMLVLKDFSLQKEKIIFLANYGFSNREISEIVGTSQGSVRATLSQAKSQERAQEESA